MVEVILLFKLAGLQVQTPVDVPAHHWARKPVEALFEAGVLKGYPESARLDPVTRPAQATEPETLACIRRMMAASVIGDFFSNRCIRGGGDFVPGRFDYAVFAYSATQMAKEHVHGSGSAAFWSELPEIARLVVTYAPELKAIGAGPDAMLLDLRDIRGVEFKG